VTLPTRLTPAKGYDVTCATLTLGKSVSEAATQVTLPTRLTPAKGYDAICATLTPRKPAKEILKDSST